MSRELSSDSLKLPSEWDLDLKLLVLELRLALVEGSGVATYLGSICWRKEGSHAFSGGLTAQIGRGWSQLWGSGVYIVGGKE